VAAFVTGTDHDDDQKLRIALVIGSLRIGGTETQAVRLAADLRARGHDVYVIALAHGGPLETGLRSSGIPVRILAYRGLRLRDDNGWRSPRTLLAQLREVMRLWRFLREIRADICHAFGFTCYTIALPLAWAAGVPVRVNGRRGVPPASPTGLPRRVLDRLSDRSSSVYVCNSRAGAADLVRHEGVRADRIIVIPNSVSVPRSVATAGHHPARGVVVANLIHYKGHADLVEALATLEAPPRMCFVGDGPERDALAELCAVRGLVKVIDFAGTVPNASGLLTAYQFAVLASHEEGLPNALLEAMAAGLPVIATSVGGVPEIVTDGVTGTIVRPHAPVELAAAITRLVGDPALRARMGAAGRRTAERFSLQACAERHETAYLAQLR
jgi:glycosyltransferase involved in cell wall biosynthesis